ncbi:MAG: hypothetical protein WBA13_05890 [Microcoleaceae cyanobacterium]
MMNINSTHYPLPVTHSPFPACPLPASALSQVVSVTHFHSCWWPLLPISPSILRAKSIILVGILRSIG